MALRLAMRRFCSKPVPLGVETSPMSSLANSVTSFSPSTFFEEKYFWKSANLGPFFLLLIFGPTLYRGGKDMYWTGQAKKLNTEEVISDRYEWLKVSMIQDEVEATLLKQAVPAPLTLGPALPP
mmetsp:Transcript_44321/g.77805  ORF Transcript_44321/g.77805 Transcript_44321/m.77805 type:complete len:124 (+) Transcript_44321:84-455(+)